MTVLGVIDYILVVIFFLITGALLLLIARGTYQGSEVAPQKQQSEKQQPVPPERKIAYAVLGAIFLFFALVAWAANRHSSH
jgi:hypothetical protein